MSSWPAIEATNAEEALLESTQLENSHNKQEVYLASVTGDRRDYL